MTYRHTPDMGEISGFGGRYEEACQTMLEAGVTWLVENRERNPDFAVEVIPDVFGSAVVTGEAGKALEEVVVGALGDEPPSMAMHHAVMTRLVYIHDHGWDSYCLAQRDARELRS